MTMTNENVVENIDEIVMRLREIRRVADMLALLENFQIQIEAEAEAEAEAVGDCIDMDGECVCILSAGHKGDHKCSNVHSWSNENEALLSPETETPPVKVGDKVRVIAKHKGNLYTIGQTVIVELITDIDIKTRSLDNSETWFLGYDEFEIIPESESAPKPEGLTVAELIGKLQRAPNQNAAIRLSIKGGHLPDLKEVFCYNERGTIYLRDDSYGDFGGEAL